MCSTTHACAQQHTTMCSSTRSIAANSTSIVFSCTHIASTFDYIHVNYNRNHCTHVDRLQNVCPCVLLDDTLCNVATRPSMFMHPRTCVTRYARRHATQLDASLQHALYVHAHSATHCNATEVREPYRVGFTF